MRVNHWQAIRASVARRFPIALVLTSVWLCSTACAAPEAPRPAFVLLYSTVGYEAGGTKRALVRGLVGPAGPIPDVDRSRWRLLAESGAVVAEGRLRARGDTFGSPLWEIDFSAMNARHEGLRLAVRLQFTADSAGDAPPTSIDLESLPFAVEPSLFSNRMALGLSLRNAQRRRAPRSMGGGYYDCNSKMGEAYSHAMFAAGLIEFDRRRGDTLEAAERAGLEGEIHRAIDYVLSLHDDATGEIANQHPSRPGGNPGAFNTQEGVYGLAQYLALGSGVDPRRASEIERRARASLVFLDRTEDVYPELGAAVWARLYAQSGNANDLAEGVRHVEVLLSTFTPRTRLRHPLRGVPWFEGLVLLAPAVDASTRSRWMERVEAWGRDLVGAAARNGYGVVPPLGEAAWDDMESAPVSEVEHAFFANAHFLATTFDLLLLADLVGGAQFESPAAAGLQWVTGVNPGVRSTMVTAPSALPGESPTTAASFVVGGPGRSVLPWQRWWWSGVKGATGIQTTVNGFIAPPGRGLVYDVAEWQPAETFIRTDGLLLRAALSYEDHLAGGQSLP